jgi:NADP-dependent 3-hydroxy acid dehydrogenase YdfG
MLQAIKDEVKSDNLHIHTIDVSKEDDVITIFQSIKEKFGTCNLLVNNAGMAIAGDCWKGDTNL